MQVFDASKEWVILLPPDALSAKKAASDLARYIGLLAGYNKARAPRAPAIMDAHASSPLSALIVLQSEGQNPERNGYSWRAEAERVEILGESDRGLCNGIYSFLSALGLSWPRSFDSGEDPEKLPAQVSSVLFPLSVNKAHESSKNGRFRRFIPPDRTENLIFKKGPAFAAWAARRRFDAVIFPLAAFASRSTSHKLKQLKQYLGEYGISLEAGGRDLSSLVPRSYFPFHRDFFRMEEGLRKKAHHFCPTNPGAIKVIESEGGRLFRAAGACRVFHLWPDRDAEAVWCACPSCRAFTPAELNRIAVNAAADVLAKLNPEAVITYYEKPDEGGNIPMRKNLVKMERLPDEGENI